MWPQPSCLPLANRLSCSPFWKSSTGGWWRDSLLSFSSDILAWWVTPLHEYNARCLDIPSGLDRHPACSAQRDRTVARLGVLLDVVTATSPLFFQQGTRGGICHSFEYGDFWRQRIWRTLLESTSRRRNEPHNL